MKKDFSDFGIEIPFGKQTGKVKTHCPHCHSQRRDKRDKSLSVDLDKGVWNCHYCNWAGSIHTITEEDKQRWMERQPWYRPKQVRRAKPEYKRPQPRTTTPMSDRALAWFAGRGISAQTLQDLRVTEGMEWMPQKNGQANTVQFNFYRDGQLINTKFRTGDKCFKLVSGAELIPYNIDAIKGTPECIITEGEIDALSFHEAGRKDVVSVPNGANSVDWLDDFMEAYFEDKQTIYIAVDTDTKGTQLRDELLRRFGPERCRVVDFGEDCKDANEHLQAHGKDSLLQCLAQAPEIKVEGVFTISDFEQSLDAIYEYGLQKGATLGFPNLDNLISFETKRLCLVTGYPSSGKSEFIDEMAERLNLKYGWRFAYFSPENAPLAYHASKLTEKFTGKKFSRETLPLREYEQVKAHLEENFFFINPTDYKVSTILEKAKYLVRRRGIKALVIDPYNRLEHERGGMSETDYIGILLDRLTIFAQQNDVLVILMAHPTKPAKNKDGKIDPPTLYDISGSAHFFNKADFGIVVHRDKQAQTVDIRIEKVKFRHLGIGGVATMKFNINNSRYCPYDPNQEPQWDNTNHLVEEQRRREQDIADAARLNFDAFTANGTIAKDDTNPFGSFDPTEEVPF